MLVLTIIFGRTSVPSGIKKRTCWQSGLFQNCSRNKTMKSKRERDRNLFPQKNTNGSF